MILRSHIVTGTLDDIRIPLTGGCELALSTVEGLALVPCTKALHDAINLPQWIGQPVILGVLLNADGRFIDTMTALVNRPENAVSFIDTPAPAATTPPGPGPSVPMHEHCQKSLRAAGKPYPRTCTECKLGPCKFHL